MLGDFETVFFLKITEVKNSYSLLAFFLTMRIECVANDMLQTIHQKQSIANNQT